MRLFGDLDGDYFPTLMHLAKLINTLNKGIEGLDAKVIEEDGHWYVFSNWAAPFWVVQNETMVESVVATLSYDTSKMSFLPSEVAYASELREEYRAQKEKTLRSVLNSLGSGLP